MLLKWMLYTCFECFIFFIFDLVFNIEGKKIFFFNIIYQFTNNFDKPCQILFCLPSPLPVLRFGINYGICTSLNQDQLITLPGVNDKKNK